MARDLFRLPKTQAIYLDIEDINGSVQAGMVSSSKAAEGPFASVASISFPKLDRVSDCTPPALSFVLGYLSGTAEHGYRGALYTGRGFFDQIQNVDIADVLRIANLGTNQAISLLRRPAGIWLANALPTTTTPNKVYPGGLKVFTEKRTSIANTGFPFAFKIGNATLRESYVRASGNQFFFRDAEPPAARRGVQIPNLNCFVVSATGGQTGQQARQESVLLSDQTASMSCTSPVLGP